MDGWTGEKVDWWMDKCMYALMDEKINRWIGGWRDTSVDRCVIEQIYSKILITEPNQWVYGWSPCNSSMFSICLTFFIIQHWTHSRDFQCSAKVGHQVEKRVPFYKIAQPMSSVSRR